MHNLSLVVGMILGSSVATICFLVYLKYKKIRRGKKIIFVKLGDRLPEKETAL